MRGFWDTRPFLPDHLDPAYTAWWLLSADRPEGMSGPRRIPFTAINEFAKRYRIKGDDWDELWRFIRHLDNLFLKFVEEKGKLEKERQEARTAMKGPGDAPKQLGTGMTG